MPTPVPSQPFFVPPNFVDTHIPSTAALTPTVAVLFPDHEFFVAVVPEVCDVLLPADESFVDVVLEVFDVLLPPAESSAVAYNEVAFDPVETPTASDPSSHCENL